MRVSDQVRNRHRLLKAIRSRGPVSRVELAALTGLSGALVTEVTADLIKRGLVVEQRSDGEQKRGRPRTELRINPHGGLVVGAALRTPNLLDIYFVDLAGNLLHSVEAPVGIHGNLQSLAQWTAEQLDEAISSSRFDRSAINRVAIALPGLIDSLKGVVHWVTTFDGPPFPFAEVIAKRIKIPVTIENASTCLARAEHWFGSARLLDDFSLFHIGLWIEAAQYSEGMPRAGRNGFNSEIAHVKTDYGPDARNCLCGAAGCLGQYSSIYGILRSTGHMAGFTVRTALQHPPIYHATLTAAEQGDGSALEAFKMAGEHLGRAISDHVNALDPANVIVLTQDERLLDLIREPLEASIERNTFRPLGDQTRIHLGPADKDWRWKGVAAHALEQTYLGVATSREGAYT